MEFRLSEEQGAFRRLGELGYFGLRYPEAYGGSAADMVTYCLWAEEMARGSMSVAKERLAARPHPQAIAGEQDPAVSGTGVRL